MTGSLVQLISYGSQDIFLTGNPQITFFKIVYRKYTNFAIESIAQEFIGETNFGMEMTSVIEKIGDLMYKVYLEIDIPKADLIKNTDINFNLIKEQYDNINNLYKLINNYLSSNVDVIKKIQSLLKINNIDIDNISKIINDNGTNELVNNRNILIKYISSSTNFNEIEELQKYKDELKSQINRIDIQILFNSIIKKIDKTNLSIEQKNANKKREILFLINKMIYPETYDFYQKIYKVLINKQKIYESILHNQYIERYKFAWVEELGHAIIDQLDLKIGNQLIDRHTGDWMIIYNKIYMNEKHNDNYNKMIGNISKLTDFNDEIKESYKLIIPLQFWFCRYSGASLPLISLKYHNVTLNLRIKELLNLCYFDDTCTLDIIHLQSKYGLNIINAKLYVDYIFLDTEERKRFAQSTHEYLIEVVQFNEIHNIVGKQYNANIKLINPTKFIIWFVQTNKYRSNQNGNNKCQWNNFGTKNDKTGYPISNTYIRLNSYEITDTSHDVKYFNYVQPYMYFKHSPMDGLNIYSFSLMPMEQQPSSSCNMSRIDHLGISMTFTNEFLELTNGNDIYFAVYTISYNILRFISGMAGLAFSNAF